MEESIFFLAMASGTAVYPQHKLGLVDLKNKRTWSWEGVKGRSGRSWRRSGKLKWSKYIVCMYEIVNELMKIHWKSVKMWSRGGVLARIWFASVQTPNTSNKTKKRRVRQPSVNSFSGSTQAIWREEPPWDRKRYAIPWPCKVFLLIKKVGAPCCPHWQAWTMQFFFKKKKKRQSGSKIAFIFPQQL